MSDNVVKKEKEEKINCGDHDYKVIGTSVDDIIIKCFKCGEVKYV